MKAFNERLVDIQNELKAPKNQYNSFGKYKYRSCEDILEAVKPLLLKHSLSLVVIDTIKETGGLVFVEAKVVLSWEDGIAEVTAQAGIADRKGMDIAQSFGSSSSYARKYALNGLFLIDDTKDADGTNDHKTDQPSKWLKEGTAEYDKVKKYIDEGGDLAKVKEKYNMSKEVEQLLTK